MDPEIARALVDVCMPVVTALAVAAGGWIASRLPGPLRDVMTANVHQKDVARLVEAMQRKAVAEVANHLTPPPSPVDIIAYVERVRGDLLAKMQIKPEALQTMAEAAIATAAIASPMPGPPDVIVNGGDLAVALHRNGLPGA